MLTALAMVGVVALTNAEGFNAFLAFAAGVVAVMAASGFLGYGVVDAWKEHRARRKLPPRSGRDGRGLESRRPGSVGHDPALPGARPDQTRVELRTHPPAQGSNSRCRTSLVTWFRGPIRLTASRVRSSGWVLASSLR